MACPRVYLALLQVAQPVQSEFLNREAPQHGSVDHGAPQRRVTPVFASREISHEASGKAVARSGRIVRFFEDRKSTRLNSSHGYISYAVFCLKKKKNETHDRHLNVCATSLCIMP